MDVTETSAFTAQFVTKYIPTAFSAASGNGIEETLVTDYSDLYLTDPNGVGYAVEEDSSGNVTILNRVNANDPNVKGYSISKVGDGYLVSYLGADNKVLTDSDGNEQIYDCDVVLQNSGFKLPKGTVVTLLASLDDAAPTYWYYYCQDAVGEISLNKFREMNSEFTDTSKTVYSTIQSKSSSRVTESMIFVFDFSNVAAADWESAERAGSQYTGSLKLRHLYSSSSGSQADIMDYVSVNDDGNTYSHEVPRQTDKIHIHRDTDGINSFAIANADQPDAATPSYSQNDAMNFTVEITPDTEATNTQYEERQYAAILRLEDEDGKQTAFPDGTTFVFNGRKIAPGAGNMFVVIPVETVGKHQVTVTSELGGFQVGNYRLKAELYSTSASGYYNSLSVRNTENDTAPFSILKNPEYALKVEEKNGTGIRNHFAKPGQSFQFAVTAIGGSDSDEVSVKLYSYQNGVYSSMELSEVLEGIPSLTTTAAGAEAGTWSPIVVQGAADGTYRLEFTYQDRTEYWDFIVNP